MSNPRRYRNRQNQVNSHSRLELELELVLVVAPSTFPSTPSVFPAFLLRKSPSRPLAPQREPVTSVEPPTTYLDCTISHPEPHIPPTRMSPPSTVVFSRNHLHRQRPTPPQTRQATLV